MQVHPQIDVKCKELDQRDPICLGFNVNMLIVGPMLYFIHFFFIEIQIEKLTLLIIYSLFV